MSTHHVMPRLVVDDGPAALEFYQQALGATELARYVEPDGRLVHAEVQIGDQIVSLTEAVGQCAASPAALGGSPVLLTLVVADADAVGQAMCDAGATVVIPIEDRYYGRREGRIRDPAGHLWIISQDGPDLDPDEIRRRMAAGG